MHDQYQNILVGTGREQPGLDRYLGREIEGAAGRLPDRRGQLLLRDLDDFQLPIQLGEFEDPLVRLAVLHADDRTQHLVPAQDVPQRRRQCRPVDVPRQPQRQRKVVHGVRALELGDEPQALLGVRQRNHRDSSCLRMGRRAGLRADF
ncbi:hypothetical protein GCM10022403_005900 [Streptomyces coacervatus]|uniref:Uncharacterized protein n=1 Tax=Streptomyces coacervatus TaxID=647381 RepID=A0ABP7GYC3_9ACTN